MTDRKAAVQLWVDALKAPTEDSKSRLSVVLDDDIRATTPMGASEGRDAVLAGFGASPLAPLIAQAEWSEPAGDGDTLVVSCRFPASAPVGGLRVDLRFDAADLIVAADTTLIPAPPPIATEVDFSEAMAGAINGALANGTPILMAYVDAEGRPHMSPRGSTQVFSSDRMAVWVRNPEGGLLAAIPANPHVSFFYRDPASRTSYQVQGRARVDDSPAVRDQVYANSPEVERNLDAQRRGVAVVVDVDKVEGRDASGPVLMERGAGSGAPGEG